MPIFIQYDGIDGDVTSAGHQRQLEFDSFQADQKTGVVGRPGTEKPVDAAGPLGAKGLDDAFSTADQQNGIIAILIGL